MECSRVLGSQYHHHSQQSHSLALLGSSQAGGGGAGGGAELEGAAAAAGRAVVRASGAAQGCTVLDVEMEVQQSGEQGSRVAVVVPASCSNTANSNSSSRVEQGGGGGGERLASEAAEPGGDSAQLPFSRELITFSLFGKMPPKFRRSWKESLNSRIAEVQQAFKNIPEMLYFSPSSVALHGIGVYAAESLPKDTLLGPYLGKPIRKDQVDSERDNPWLWEVYEEDSLAYFIDARDPKYGNWMNFIQCARSSLEQNLRMAQYNNHLYFVVTLDIQIGEELLVWYDQDQYDTYMGLPTGFRELPPPPLFQEQQGGTAPQANAGQSSPSAPPPTLQDHLAPPTFASFCGHTPSGGGSFSDSASTDDSGLSMETNGGPTPPTFDPSTSSHHHHHAHPPQPRDASALPTGAPNTACPLPPEGAYHAPQTIPGGSNPQLLPGMISRGNSLIGGNSLPSASSSTSSSETGGFVYAGAGLRVESTAEQLQQWYVSPLTASAIATTSDKPPLNTTPDISPAQTPSENHSSWVGPTRPFVDSPTSLPGMALLPGAGAAGGGASSGAGKKQLLYGLFSRSEDGSRWHCEECKRLFSSQGSLRAHARIHTGERPYQCQYCFRAFCQASTLRSHERLHTGEKPYKCEDCGRAFTQSAGLRSHRKTHRYDT